MSDCHFDFCSDGSHGADHGLKQEKHKKQNDSGRDTVQMTPGKLPEGGRAAHLLFGAGFGTVSGTNPAVRWVSLWGDGWGNHIRKFLLV